MTDQAFMWWSLEFNTRVVVAGTTLLGCAAGVVGSFTLLRKRALLGDALSHATLPGIGLAFLAGTWWGRDAKSMPLLLTGAVMSGLLGVGTILAIRRWTRLREDVALGLVLSIFFGCGVAILGVIQQMPTGHAAGLDSFIYGKTATMVVRDAWRIGITGSCCVAIAVGLFKELKLLCFDEAFAGSRGIPALLLDVVLMGLVVAVTIVGLQAVGLILIIALLVIPAAAARFWTDSMVMMTTLSAAFGAFSSCLGALISASLPRLPSGPVIVLVGSSIFLTSLLVGSRRGLWQRTWRRIATKSRIEKQHLLRAAFEIIERRTGHAPDVHADRTVAIRDLLPMRSWNERSLRATIRHCEREGWLQRWAHDSIRLTTSGYDEAARLVHEHRLLEIYLITHADVAPARVDRGADTIEHFLDANLIARLEEQLGQDRAQRLPESPHTMTNDGLLSREP